MKKVKGLALLMACIAASTAVAQDNVEGTVSADFVNQYIWRGQDLGDVSVQPTLGVAYKGFSLTAWGSVGLSDNSDTKEFDLTAAYQTGGFHIGITAILMTLSQKYNIVLEVEDATPKNLRNLDSIVAMVERKVAQKNQGK